MAHATMSLLGLYHYNPKVLDGFQLPKDLEPDRDTIIGNLLLETAELEILSPDPDFLSEAIRFWSTKQVQIWQELWDTTQYEYNPIWNKDGTVTELETRDLKGTADRDHLETRDLAGTSFGETSASGTDKHYVFGYNETTRAQDEEAETESGTTDSVDTTSTGTIRHDENEATTDTGTINHERRETGNIGLTTTQTMIREQREVVLFNIQDHIITDFKKRFCILVY